MDSDWCSALWSLVDAARVLSTEIPGKHDLIVAMLLGEVRRILRRGGQEP